MHLFRDKPSHIFLIGTLLILSGCTFFSKNTVDVSAPNNWTVAINPRAEKGENEYDVIVVGSGIGGLSCAALLAKHGVKVLVLEQSAHVGGFCASYERDGFTFQAGAHDISGVENGMIAILLDTLGLHKDDLFVRHTRTYTLGNSTFTLRGTKDDTVNKLSEAFPNEQPMLKAFFDEAEKALNEDWATLKDPSKLEPTYDAWSKVTYQQKLDQFFKDPELIKFLQSLLGYLGTTPENTRADKALLGNLRYFMHGGHYPKKGGQAFADALAHYVTNHGGLVMVNAKVNEILVDNNQVIGVRTSDKEFHAHIVVANANAKTTFLQLLPPHTLDASFINAIKNLKMSISLGMVNLGIDVDLSYLTSAIIEIKKAEPKVSFAINSSADKSTAPTGSASISKIVVAHYKDVPPAGTIEYARYKDNLANDVIAKLEKIIPGISKHIVVKDVITPRTFEQYTSMPEGAVYTFDQSIGSKRPYFKTPIKGLYLASASTGIGAGVEAVASTGFKVAQDILAN